MIHTPQMQPMEIIILLINKTYQWVLLVTISVTQSIFVSTAEANIFKCTNEKGAVYYNDKPCPVKNKQKKIKAEKDVVNGYQPKFENKVTEKQALTTTTAAKENQYTKEKDMRKGKPTQGSKITNNESKTQKDSSKMKSDKESETRQSEQNNDAASLINTGSNNGLNPQVELTAEQEEQLFIDTHAGEAMDSELQ